MTETIKALLADPRLLGAITSEQLLDPEDRVIAHAMEVVIANGMVPSHHAIRSLLGSLENKEHYLRLFAELEQSPIEEGRDLQFIIESARQEFNDDLLGKALMASMRSVGKERAEQVLTGLHEATAGLATSTRTESTRDIADSMMQEIQDVSEGKKKAQWSTGQPLFDRYANLAPRKIIVCASQKKQGKTRFIIDRMMRVHRLNPEVNFIFYSLEMKPQEVMLCQVAWLTKLFTSVMQGRIPGRPTPVEMEMVKRAYAQVRDMPVRYVTRSKGIDSMVHDLRRWVNGPTMVIIDNLGLIEMEAGVSDIQHEDRVAKRLVQVRDELDLNIIALHHLSKQSEGHFQKENHYRPNVSHVRGSSRISDYANQVWLLHRPGAYKDLYSMVNPEDLEAFKKAFLLDVALTRDGESGEVQMIHNLGCSSFEEMT